MPHKGPAAALYQLRPSRQDILTKKLHLPKVPNHTQGWEFSYVNALGFLRGRSGIWMSVQQRLLQGFSLGTGIPLEKGVETKAQRTLHNKTQTTAPGLALSIFLMEGPPESLLVQNTRKPSKIEQCTVAHSRCRGSDRPSGSLTHYCVTCHLEM